MWGPLVDAPWSRISGRQGSVDIHQGDQMGLLSTCFDADVVPGDALSVDRGAGSPTADFVSGFPAANIWWVEDDLELCRLIVPFLVAVGWRIHVFRHPALMLAALAKSRPDLLILDQVLPASLGIDVLRDLRKSGYLFPVLMLSGLGSPSDRIRGLEMGAQDYLAKPFHVKELLLRCEHLLPVNKEGGLSPVDSEQSIPLGPLCFHPHQRCLERSGHPRLSLTAGDSSLLLALCRAPGQVLSRAQLAQAIGSKVNVDSSRSIDVRLSRLRRLLESVSEGLLSIESVRGQGYALCLADPMGLPPGRLDK